MGEQRRVSLAPAYILHRRPYRDTSLLLECFTRDHGRVGLVARGARRARSRLPGTLQAFQPLSLSWQGRGDLATLVDAELAGTPARLAGTRLISGLYANELLVRTTRRQDPHPELFGHYTRLVTALAVEAGAEGVLLRLFERDLLTSLGYGLPLGHDAGGAPVQPGIAYRYDPDTGFHPLAGGAAGRGIDGAVLLGLAAGETGAAGSRAARELMRAALAPHLGERPLYSRGLYRQQLRAADARGGPSDTGEDDSACQ